MSESDTLIDRVEEIMMNGGSGTMDTPDPLAVAVIVEVLGAAAEFHEKKHDKCDSLARYFSEGDGWRTHCGGALGAQDAARDYGKLANFHSQSARAIRDMMKATKDRGREIRARGNTMDLERRDQCQVLGAVGGAQHHHYGDATGLHLTTINTPRRGQEDSATHPRDTSAFAGHDGGETDGHALTLYDLEYIRHTLGWVRRNVEDTVRARAQLDLALAYIDAALPTPPQQKDTNR